MEKNLLYVPTKDMSREEWLKERKKSIGGSDASAILGLSGWATPYSVWADKMSLVPDREDNEAMRIGRDLEEYVAKRWCEETGKSVRRRNAIIRNPKYPFAHADLDRVVDGENAILECKTTSVLDTKQFKNTEFPVKYYAQCVHYMMVTGADRVYLAVLHFGRGFYTYTLERDESEIKALADAEARFWKYVEEKTEPPVDGEEPTTETIKAIWAESNGTKMPLYGRDEMLDLRMAKMAEIARLEKEVEEIDNTIKLDMGEAEIGESESYKVTWKSQAGRQSFDSKKFMSDHKDIDYSAYIKISKGSRPFKVTVKKEK